MRMVRLNDDAEAKLAALRKQTGLSDSNVLKRGPDALAKESRGQSAEMPYEVFRRVQLASNENAAGSAAEVKARIANAIKNKYGR